MILDIIIICIAGSLIQVMVYLFFRDDNGQD
jgi:hypothetical protein